jgi:hypothetical protein
MARKTHTRTAPAARIAPEPRNVLLAGIGAISLGRKQFLRAYADGFQGLAAARDRAQDAFVSAAAQLDAQVDELRRQADRWRKKAEAYRGQVEHRFGPVLAKVGVPVSKPRAKRKPAKPAARRRRAA